MIDVTEKFFINGKMLDVEIAKNFFSRLRGLMFRQKLETGRGLLLAPCDGVHMFFMRFAIDVVYLDKNFCIKKIVVFVLERGLHWNCPPAKLNV